MTYTYSGSPSLNDRDKVRFLVGDTDPADQLVRDEEIAYALARTGDNIDLAAAVVCEALASRFTTCPDQKVGDLQQSSSQIAQGYKDQAKHFRSLASANADIFVGGITVSGNKTLDEDTDAAQPSFSIGMGDFPGTSSLLDDPERCGA